MTDELRARVQAQVQGAAALGLAFVGVANGLFDALEAGGTVEALTRRTGLDAGYLHRWCEGAYAFGYLDEAQGNYQLTELGQLYRPGVPGSLMPTAVQAVLGAHVMERAAGLMKTGEQPGESVLAERESILPWFGPMLEVGFGALFEMELLPRLPLFSEVDARGGLVVDLGCGNGWYLRALCKRYPRLRGLGLDGFGENIRQATARAESDGLRARLRFTEGDLFSFQSDEPVDVVAMNRALHHVWHDREKVLTLLRDSLRPGGAAVIWEPAWPAELSALREPRRRAMAFQNLSEHVQGNHFLRPGEIEAAFRQVGMHAETHLFNEGTEAVVVGTR
ncbi:MAG: class I SAM-dependent methyltransferase [Myxococcaceae bacterium]